VIGRVPLQRREAMTRTRRAPAILIVVLATLATQALAPAASATFPDRNGRIAFQAQTDQGIQIFTVRSNGHDLQQITHVDGDATQADWAPDGRRIAFALNECSIALINPDGRNLDVIASDPDLCQGDPAFTPDGARLVYVRFDPALEIEQVWSMKTDGTDKHFVTGLGGPDPNVSPDGRKISFKGPDALFVANLDGSGAVQVSPSISVTFKHDWAPDGQHLVVSDNSDPSPDESVNVVTVRPDGSEWTYLTHYPAGFRANAGTYSPDGQWIVFRLEGPGLVPTVYRIRPDGSDLHALFSSSTIVPRSIDWGPAASR
jgi:Tol biopolymer transport system component